MLDRVKIKKRAKELTGAHIWSYWKLMIYVILLMIVISVIGAGISESSYTGNLIITFLTQLATAPLTVGIYWCLLCIVRTGKYTTHDIFKFFKYCWLIVLLQILISIFTWLWMLLLIIPGIIAAISYSMSFYIFAESEEKPMECIRKSKALMKGYKADYFIFCLSFLGWFLLGAFTCGILYIWIIPYFQFATSVYYNELVNVNKNELTNV